jgi:16S rRNA U516 pseudouridylate synthase RsuA-like enzyme
MKLYLLLFKPRHLSEQYFTSSQTFAHFLRQENGLPQVAQVLVGRLDFETPRISAFGANR